MTNLSKRPELTFGVPSLAARQLPDGTDSPQTAEARDVRFRFPDTARRMWLPLALLVTCQLADLVTFSLAVGANGPAHESGPFRFVYQDGGLLSVAVLKLAGAVLSAVVLALHPWRSLTTPRRLALLSAAVGTFGAFTNVLALR